MARFATTLCFAFFFYIAGCSAQTASDLTSQVTNQITTLQGQNTALDAAYASVNNDIAAQTANATSTANSRLQNYQNQQAAILATAPAGANTTACVPDNTTYVNAVSASQQETTTCLSALSATATNQYNAAKAQNNGFIATLQGYLTQILGCAFSVPPSTTCLSGVQSQFTSLTSSSAYVSAVSPDAATNTFSNVQSQIPDCSNNTSGQLANQIQQQNLQFTQQCVANLNSTTG